MSNLWIPQHLKPAVTRTKIVFYRWKTGGVTRYTVGAPEQFPAPRVRRKSFANRLRKWRSIRHPSPARPRRP
jgi:hypothetical protein